MDVVYSTDGGATWNTNIIDGSDDGLGTGIRADPTITFDELGRLYIGYGFLATATATYRLMVATDAANGGASFEQFTEVDSVVGGGGIDKWIMTVRAGPDQ
jgi:hypothetical protein